MLSKYYPNPSWVDCCTFDSHIDTTLTKYKKKYSEEHLQLVEKFNNWQETARMSWSDFKQNPVTGATVELRNKDFEHGTVRLIHSARYILMEDIVFEPNKEHDHLPTSEQTAGGKDAEYPIAPFGAYTLGFFAAITIEGQDIVLDLNNKVLRQSHMFDVQQRFYANIELASSPFVPPQGPAAFGDHISSAKNCLITNGVLGLSSHHGIHGNSASHVIIQNLIITEFEVAGIAMNGCEHSVIRNINICKMSQDIDVLSTYSAARFIRKTLDKVPDNTTFNGKTKQQIKNDLVAEMDKIKNAVNSGEEIPNSVFKNTSGLYDGGAYGIVLNTRGIVVNDFIKNTEKRIGNHNIMVHDIVIEDLVANGGEIVGLSREAKENDEVYGAKIQAGPVGSVLQINNVQKDGRYVGNVIADAKMLCAKAGFGSIHKNVIEWAESGKDNLDEVLLAQKLYYVSGGDSMAHFMKGMIGLFVSSADTIKCWDIKINNIRAEGLLGAENSDQTETKPEVRPLIKEFNGNNVRGVCITGSDKVLLQNVKVKNLYSKYGSAIGVDVLHKCDNIRLRDNVKCTQLLCVDTKKQGKSPNPQSKPIYCRVSEESTNVLH